MSSPRSDFVALRLATLARTPGFLGDNAASRQRLGSLYDRGSDLGLVHERLHVGDRPVAQLAFFRDPAAWFGGPVVLAFVDRDPTDAAALAAIGTWLARHASALDGATLLEVTVHDRPLLEVALASGFGISSVAMVGEPRSALAALGPADDTPLGALGLSVVAMQHRHVGHVVALHRSVFQPHPEWCWFCGEPSHLRRVAADLASRREHHLVLLRGDDVVGHAGGDLVQDDAFWGTHGGLELVLRPELHGRGLARPLYRRVLGGLVQRGAVALKGHSAQPGVLALAKVMRRPWHAFDLRRGAHFAPEHFLRFAD